VLPIVVEHRQVWRLDEPAASERWREEGATKQDPTPQYQWAELKYLTPIPNALAYAAQPTSIMTAPAVR
jgi:hypothetical protein